MRRALSCGECSHCCIPRRHGALHGMVRGVRPEHYCRLRKGVGGAYRPCTAYGQPEKEEIKVSVVVKSNAAVNPWAVMVHAQHTCSTYAAMMAESGLGLLADGAPAFGRWVGIQQMLVTDSQGGSRWRHHTHEIVEEYVERYPGSHQTVHKSLVAACPIQEFLHLKEGVAALPKDSKHTEELRGNVT